MTHYDSYITNREEAKNKAVMVRTRAEKDLQQVRVKTPEKEGRYGHGLNWFI